MCFDFLDEVVGFGDVHDGEEERSTLNLVDDVGEFDLILVQRGTGDVGGLAKSALQRKSGFAERAVQYGHTDRDLFGGRWNVCWLRIRVSVATWVGARLEGASLVHFYYSQY